MKGDHLDDLLMIARKEREGKTMKMTIKTLNIQNFRQIESQSFHFHSGLNRIIGKNGSGKTNTLHAISWLFFGTDYTNRSQFAVVPIHSDGTESELDPEVEIQLEINDRPHTLKRVLSKGKTQTYLDGVPCKTLKQFNDFVSGIFESQERFRMFSNPSYFTESLHWKEQRDLFMKFFPLPSNDDVIAELSKERDFRTEMSDFGSRSVESEIQRVKYILKEADTERQSIRSKVELLDDQLEGNHTLDQDDLIAERDALRAEHKGWSQAVQSRSKEIAEAQYMRQNLEDEMRKLIQQKERALETAEQVKKRRIQDLTYQIDSLERFRTELVEKYRKLKVGIDQSCSMCGQELPEAHLDEIKSKHELALSETVLSGQETAQRIKDIKDEIRSLDKPPVVHTDIEGQLSRLRAQIAEIVVPERLPEFDDDKLARLDEIERTVSRAEVHKENLQRRADLRKREIEIGREFEWCESRLLDMADMIQKRSEILTRRVNDHFDTISVTVVETQKNGLDKETFEIMRAGIPYKELNTAGQLEASLELTQFLKKSLGVRCPMLIDNGERYTDVNFGKVDDQIITAEAVKGQKLEQV